MGRLGSGLPAPLDALVPLVQPAHVAMLGPRDAAEIEAGGEASIRNDVAMFLDDRHVRDTGGAAAVAAALDAIGEVAFWLHVDLDVLATTSFAAVDYPQAGGLAWSQLRDAFMTALSHDRCRGASVAIYNPDLDPDRSDARKVVEFLARTVR
jgi:arginase